MRGMNRAISFKPTRGGGWALSFPPLDPLHKFREVFCDRGAVVVLPALVVEPAQPIGDTEKGAGSVQDEDIEQGVETQRPYRTVNIDPFAAESTVVPCQTADHPGKVSGDVIELDASEVDQSANCVTIEQYMIVPDITKTRLHFHAEANKAADEIGSRGDATLDRAPCSLGPMADGITGRPVEVGSPARPDQIAPIPSSLQAPVDGRKRLQDRFTILPNLM
jgi:hypothetical protein